MRLLTKYILKQLFIPFIFSLLIIVFVLFTQFLLRAIDRFLGNVVESFLELNDNFSLESGKNFIPNNWLNQQNCLETFPPRDRVDGMFAARLRKK